jgi:protein TonB
MLPELWSGDVVAYVTNILPPPPPAPVIRRDIPEQPASNPNTAPTEAPTGITKEPERLPIFETDTPSVGLVIGDPRNGPVEPLAPPPSAPVEPIRVGGTIRPPLKIRDAQPVYSPFAIAARMEGIVIIDATIGVDGQVLNVRLLRSVGQLLDQAALDAVRQWQFTPSLLNGVPVPVLMTVTVRFTLK